VGHKSGKSLVGVSPSRGTYHSTVLPALFSIFVTSKAVRVHSLSRDRQRFRPVSTWCRRPSTLIESLIAVCFCPIMNRTSDSSHFLEHMHWLLQRMAML
jgi:hypothetical protein